MFAQELHALAGFPTKRKEEGQAHKPTTHTHTIYSFGRHFYQEHLRCEASVLPKDTLANRKEKPEPLTLQSAYKTLDHLSLSRTHTHTQCHLNTQTTWH